MVACALLTRFWDLGSRGFHQDEAVHAWLAHLIASGRGYHYDPVYHGPLLYHLEAFVFRILGSGDVQARLVPAVCGVLLVVLLYRMLGRHLGTPAALAAASLAVLSPSLTYYSRFNSHDILIAVFTVVMVAAPFDYRRSGLIWFAAAAGLALSTKLNAYFVVATLVLYFVCRALYGRLRGRPLTVVAYIRMNPAYVATAAALALSVAALLALLTLTYYVRGEGQSVARAALTTIRATFFDGFAHWSEMHRTGRLGGPFHFYLPLLLIYEPLALCGFAAALVYYMRRRLMFVAAATVLLVALWGILRAAPWLAGLLLNGSTLEPWHVLFGSVWMLAGAWTVVALWDDDREFLACWLFFGVVQFLLYSYANEKVPWLVVHIVLPWLVVVAALLVDLMRLDAPRFVRAGTIAFLVLLASTSAHASWVVNTRNRSSVAEPLIQLDYAPAVSQTIARVRRFAASVDEPSLATIERDVQWPFVWYLRDLPVLYRVEQATAAEVAPLLVTAGVTDAGLERRYEPTVLPYDGWSTWMAAVDRGDLRGLLRFMLFHDRWSTEGGRSFVFWFRRDLASVP